MQKDRGSAYHLWYDRDVAPERIEVQRVGGKAVIDYRAFGDDAAQQGEREGALRGASLVTGVLLKHSYTPSHFRFSPL